MAGVYIEPKSSDLQKNLLDTISCCEKALLVYRKYRDLMGWVNAHSELAIAHKNLGNCGKAIEINDATKPQKTLKCQLIRVRCPQQ